MGGMGATFGCHIELHKRGRECTIAREQCVTNLHPNRTTPSLKVGIVPGFYILHSTFYIYRGGLSVTKVLIADALAPRAAELLKEGGLEVETRLKMKPDELGATLHDGGYAAVLVRSDTKLTRIALEQAVGLKLIVRAGVGLDNVDAVAAQEHGIHVTNTPAATTTSVAELVVGMMLALARRIPAADRSVRAGQWERKAFMGRELRGGVLGILGIGRIGSAVAHIAQAIGMSVIAYDPYVSAEAMAAQGVTAQTMEQVIANADVLTIHLPLNDETANMLNRERLLTMKQGAFVINAARGGVLDEKAVADLLREGHLGGAAFDVYETEPPGADNPLIVAANADPGLNIVFTPHIAASTNEGQVTAAIQAAEIVLNFFKGN
jgi:D-3-phosphoglycerate dehydrogenase